MSHRFFLNSAPTGPTVSLDGDQAHHAIHVMRFNTGDEVTLFDGSGVEHIAIIEQIQKKRIELRIVESVMCHRGLSSTLTLCVALPKGDRQKFLIEKLVELGVHRLVPLSTRRSVAVANANVIQRLQKQVIEASKQCGRNTLMSIDPPQTIDQLATTIDPSTTLLIANPYQGKPISSYLSDGGKKTIALIGPEGGFDESENQAASEVGFLPVRLGPAILRVETAAIAVAAILGIGSESQSSV